MSAPHRRQPKAWVVSLCLPAAALLLLPGAASAVDAGPATVRAVVGGDGSVKQVKQYSQSGDASRFDGKLPVALSIQRSKDGARQTLRYHVENTQSATQDVAYTDTAGVAHTSKVELQLPLVAQLGVTVPTSMRDIQADGATITTDADGTKHLLWQMVLFSPLGAPVQDVFLSASGSGIPAAQVRAIAVDPTTSPGLGGTAQAANAAQTQDDFWHQYASGGDDGLTKLRAGMSKIVAGLELLAPGSRKLADGLGAAGDGATKLDAGTLKAKAGAGELSTGLGKIAAGQTDLTAGLTLIHDGQQSLTDGLTQIHDGQGALTTGLTQLGAGQDSLTGGLTQINAGQTSLTGGLTQLNTGQTALTGGLTQIHDGQAALTTGLTQLSGGLTQLNAGLPAALDGVSALAGGVQKLLAGVGTRSDSGSTTLLGVVNQLIYGVTHTATSTTDPGGLKEVLTSIKQGVDCASVVLADVVNGATAAPAGTLACWPSGRPALTGLKNVATVEVAAGLNALYNGLVAAQTGAGQLAAGATAAVAGSTQLTAGTGAALDGSKQLAAGTGAALTGSQQLADGTAKALDGSQQLSAGTGKALVGSQQLYDGSGKALAGSQQLTDGSGKALDGSTQLRDGSVKAYDGSKALFDGLGQLSAGQHKVATGLPAAIDGANQIADGLSQVLPGGVQIKDGIGAVQDQAVAPLKKQLAEGSQNARQQVAVLAAAGALASKAPGGVGTTYVLAQSGFDLAAASTSTDDGVSDGAKVGLGVGGLLLLVLGTAGGFLAGRKRETA
ncbi:MAG: hypothetical protein LC789_05990 [Actinobacteria bacterium]|nr:hypothetical protein [Actinomycetota bacterium]